MLSCSVVSDSMQTPWTVACQASCVHRLSHTRILEWVAVSFSGGDLPDPGIDPASPVSPALAGGFFTVVPPGNANI